MKKWFHGFCCTACSAPHEGPPIFSHPPIDHYRIDGGEGQVTIVLQNLRCDGTELCLLRLFIQRL